MQKIINNIKVICLMPVKNEVDILPITLDIISKYCDVIIIADQMSDDGSREIYKRFSKVKVINNHRDGHSNQVRWDLLKAAREHEGNNLILCLDADEYIPPDLFNKFLEEHDFRVGDSYRFPWIQLWKSVNKFNDTGAWYKNYQRAAWIDDGKTDYDNEFIINDHVSRVPKKFLNNCKRIDNIPIIHLQWASWRKTQFKQAWYRCTELIKKPKDYISINSAYSISLDCNKTNLSPIKKEWMKGTESVKLVESFEPSWHAKEIIQFFNEYGILFFEPLQIWHIPELEQEFIKRIGRKPKSVSENILIRKIKDFKRFIIKFIHY
jgi:hypothetical protein